MRELQAAGVYVMPYINGRLWDTRDRGSEDFEFTDVARPAATKDEDGKPYIEIYGSKESDGSPVRLARDVPDDRRSGRSKVREIVLRLMNECGVQGRLHRPDRRGRADALLRRVPRPSARRRALVDRGLLEAAGRDPRATMPDDRMLTTECNAEPYIRMRSTAT